MSVARINAGIMSTIIFLITAVACIGLSMLIITTLGLYSGVISVFGSGSRSGSFIEAMFNLFSFFLIAASLFLAYRLARKTHRWVICREAAMDKDSLTS